LTRTEVPDYVPPSDSAESGADNGVVEQADVAYGWVHVAVAAAAMIGTLPGRTHGLGLITEPLLRDTQLDRTLYANLNVAATLLGALFCWPAGVWLDRWGTRRVLTAIAVSFGAVVVSMSYINLATPLVLLAALTLTRALGQSMLSVASLALVGKSFRERLGPAMAAYSVLVGIGFGVAYRFTGSSIQKYGWREAWAGIGWLLIAGLAPLGWILVRDSLLMKPPAQPESSGRQTSADATLAQALASPVFWVFALASSFYGMVSTGLALFNEAILAERGFSADIYYSVLSIGALSGMFSNLLGGWAATRCGLRRLLSAAMVLLAASLAALPQIDAVWQVYTYAIVFGAAGGIITVSFFTVWGAVFGRTHLGQIQGAAQMLTVLASAAGSRVFDESLTRTGSYMAAFYLLAPISLFVAAAALSVRTLPVAPPLHGGDPMSPTRRPAGTSFSSQQESSDHVYRD
jgi:MFS family permease